MKALRLLVLSLLSFVVILAGNEGQAQAQSGIVWRTQFFNNDFLSGSAVITRNDAEIAFNWGTGSPATGVNADNFSARFTTRAYFENRAYRFSIVADDGVKLIIDDSIVIINTFDNPRPSQTLTADIQLSAGHHNVQLDFREVKGDAFVYLGWLPVNGSNPPVVVTQSPFVPATSGWTAEYFANTNLSGSPSAILSVIGPSNNWGTGSPTSNIPADNFSARWTGTMQLDGTYDLTIRADDGVRVSVDGVTYINEWHSASDRTYTARFTVSSGTHKIVIEYYEASGNAFLEYGLIRIDNVVNNPPQPSTGGSNARIVVTSSELNVRQTPSLVGNILARITKNQSYTIVGRNTDSSWWQINVNGTVGWVNAYYTSASNIQNVPVTSANTQVNPPATGNSATATANVNLRTGAGINYGVLNVIPRNASVSILARNLDRSWWQVNYRGIIGWVSARYIAPPSTTDLNQIPISQ